MTAKRRKLGLAAALKAAKAAGLNTCEIVIDPDGRITITTGAPESNAEARRIAAAEQEWLDRARKPAVHPEKQVWLDLARKRP